MPGQWPRASTAATSHAVGCRAWNEVVHLERVLEELRDKLPQPDRPLKEPYRSSGLAAKQDAAREAVERERRKVNPPKAP
jgi:hypothetical protein